MKLKSMVVISALEDLYNLRVGYTIRECYGQHCK